MSSGTIDQIDDRTVPVWTSRPDRIADADLVEACRSVLDAGERARMERLHFAQDRHTYLVAHALVRWALSRYEDRDPASWRFIANEHGRPEVAPTLRSRLRFNLSHTQGLVACAIAIDRAIGIDVEKLRRREEMEEVAGYALTEDEHRVLAQLPDELRRRRVLEYWTLKEAYVKARGRGLDLPLNAISMQIAEGRAIAVGFTEAIEDDPRAWQFLQCWVTERESLAVAVSRTGNDLAVLVRDVVPLAD